MTHALTSLQVDEIARIRAETPGVRGRLHLDNCGASLMPTPVIEAVSRHFALEVELGGYVAQEQQSDRVEAVYSALAKLLGGAPDEYAIAGSAVDAWTKAFYSVPFEPGDNIVTSFNEYCSNFVAFLQQAARRDVEIRVARARPDGDLDLDHLESLIDDRTKLIGITQAPSSSGQVSPVAEVGRIARARGILYLLDACQAVGQLPVDVTEIGCHMMTGTSRKFLRGPRGIGFLYVARDALPRLDPVMLTNQAAAWVGADRYELRRDARVFEGWERNVCNMLGFGAAIDYLLELGPLAAFDRIRTLADHLRAGLAAIPGVTPTCPPAARSAIITFNKAGLDAAYVKRWMDERGVGVQIASVVHTRLDLEARGIDTAARVSPHYFNTIEDLDRFLGLLEDMT